MEDETLTYEERQKRAEKKKLKTIKRIVIGLIIFFLVLILNPFGTIGAGERGIQLRFGAVTGKIFDEGLYFRIPLVEKVKRIDVKIQKEEVTATAASKDLQIVTSIVALNFHIDPDKVADIYQDIGMQYDERIIAPAIQESVKAATAQFTAEECITKRAEVREAIKSLLVEKIGEVGIVIHEFNIIDLDFSASFNKAIEAKVTAEQEALKAQKDLQRVEFEAEQKVTKATADAEAIRIQAQAITQQGGKDYVQLQAIDKWNGILPVNWYGGAVLPFININQ